MGKKFDFEYAVIGGGPAGRAAAIRLAQTKKRVIIVTEGEANGNSFWSRSMSFRAGREFADLYYKTKSAEERGLAGVHFNLPTVANWQERVERGLAEKYQGELERAGIKIVPGRANLLSQNLVAVGEQQFSAAKIILATGSELKMGGVSVQESVRYYKPEEALKIRRLPKAVAVVGGGASGVGIAEYFAKLGTRVLLFEISARVLPREDEEVGKVVEDYLSNELGVTVLKQARVVALDKDELSQRVIFLNNGAEKLVRVDAVVMATGTQPVLDYGLENAGVEFNIYGLTVNKYLQTTAKNIYAVGDAAGGEQSEEKAVMEGLLAADNLVRGNRRLMNYSGLARVTKITPEVAVIGFTEEDLIRRGRKYRKATTYLTELTMAGVMGEKHGMVKILTDVKKQIIGAILVGEGAEELARLFVMVIKIGMAVRELGEIGFMENELGKMVKLALVKLN